MVLGAFVSLLFVMFWTTRLCVFNDVLHMIVVTLLRVNKQNDPNEDDEDSLDFDGILPQKKQVDVASITEFCWIKNMKLY